MKYCLCCGKPLEENSKESWHHKCIKKFFDCDALPKIDLSNANFTEMAKTSLTNSHSVTGVQKKLSAHLEKGGKDRPNKITVVGYPSGYIIKPQSDEYKHLPEMEHLTMLLAEIAEIKVVSHGLLNVDGEFLYITKRIDRQKVKKNTIKIHMEDFCQASNLPSSNKYRSSYEHCGELIDRYSANPLLDKTTFFKAVCFCFIVGNSDMHLKNFSFIMDDEGNLTLTPFYDLLCVRLAMPSDNEDLALSIRGKKTNLARNDFLFLAKSLGIDDTATNKIIASVISKKEEFIQAIKKSFLNQSQQSQLIKIVEKNIKRLNK